MDSRLFWLSLAAFVGAIEGGLIAGILPLISEDLGVSLGQAGMLVLFYSLAYAFGPPLLALLLGGVGRRRILAWSEFGLAVCALLMVLVPFFEGLVIVRTVLAGSTAKVSVPLLSYQTPTSTCKDPAPTSASFELNPPNSSTCRLAI